MTRTYSAEADDPKSESVTEVGKPVAEAQLSAQQPTAPARIAPVYTALLIIVLLGALDHTIVATALPTVIGELDGARHMAWIITSYTLAMTIGMPIYGRLGDRFGRPIMMTVALVIFLGASLLCGFAQDMVQLTLFRALQGLGGAGMVVLPAGIIADLVPPRQRAKYLGPLGSVFGIATIVSPLAGGAITDTIGWRWVFWINLPIGLLALAMALSLHRLHGKRGSGGMDWLGMGTMITFTCALVGAVALSTETGIPSELITGLSILAAVSGVLFVLVESRSSHALIPMHMFRSWPVVNAAGLGVVIGAGLFSVVAYLPTYIQMVYSTSASVAGMILLPLVLGMMAASNLSGWLVTRTGHYKVFPLAGSALAAAAAIGLSLAPPTTPMSVVAVLIALLGLAVGSFMQVTVVVAQNAMPHSMVGGVTASLGYLRELGVTAGTALFGGLFATLLAKEALASSVGLPTEAITNPLVVQQLPAAVQSDIAAIYSDAFHPIFWLLAGIFGIGVLLSILMPQQQLSDD